MQVHVSRYFTWILACAQSSEILDTTFFLFAFYFIKIIQIATHLIKLSTSSSHLIMIVSISIFINFKIVRYLLLHWRSNAIAAEFHCDLIIVYKVQINIFVYKQSIRLKSHFKDSSRRICKSVEIALIQYLEEQLWTQQSEMIWFLWEK
jgi:hypothetical protein